MRRRAWDAEQVRELGRGLRALGRLLGLERLRVDDRGRDGEQLRADVDDAAQEGLLALHRRLPAAHPVEDRARELARVALGEPQVVGELAEVAEVAGGWPLPTTSWGSHLA